jgi:hypothetical protein
MGGVKNIKESKRITYMSNAVTQSILLRRTNIAGKVPTTASIQLGELAVNTNDGRVFIKKDDGVNVTIEQLVVTGAEVTGSINILGSGSFGYLEVTGDANFDGNVQFVSASGYFTGSFAGDGSGLTGVTASMRPDDFDFNKDAFAGTVGYIQGTGSLYAVVAPSTAIEFTYNDSIIATITNTNGYSGSVYGIGDVLSFSSSIYTQFAAGTDAGVWA